MSAGGLTSRAPRVHGGRHASASGPRVSLPRAPPRHVPAAPCPLRLNPLSLNCPRTVPELSPSSVYFRRFPSSGPSRKSLSFRVWLTVTDDGFLCLFPSNPVWDASCHDCVAGSCGRFETRLNPVCPSLVPLDEAHPIVATLRGSERSCRAVQRGPSMCSGNGGWSRSSKAESSQRTHEAGGRNPSATQAIPCHHARMTELSDW